ncbi:MAG: DUF4293 domain-containing protein [Bacteroidota bacterium]
MIQRIQTVFLFLAAACAFGLFGLPFATSEAQIANSTNFSDSIYNLNDHVALLILFAAAGLLSLVSIFLFNNRKTQLLVGRFSIIANVIGLILAVVLFMNDQGNILDATKIEDGIGAYLPFLFLVFAILAQRYITKDEKLVSSMDRLR